MGVGPTGIEREPRKVTTREHAKNKHNKLGMNSMTHMKEIPPPEDTSPATVGPQLLKMIGKENTHLLD